VVKNSTFELWEQLKSVFKTEVKQLAATTAIRTYRVVEPQRIDFQIFGVATSSLLFRKELRNHADLSSSV
jgi:hypothetical protein